MLLLHKICIFVHSFESKTTKLTISHFQRFDYALFSVKVLLYNILWFTFYTLRDAHARAVQAEQRSHDLEAALRDSERR